MSKAEKKVKWCLSKAKKEIDGGTKHRGLVKIEPDHRLALLHVKKAEHNLQVLLDNKKLGHYDWTINIGFYTMYHCCLAIISEFGYESRNQECTLALIENLIEDGMLDSGFSRYLESIMSDDDDEDDILPMREKTQYSPVVEIEKQKVEELLGICQDMLKETKGIIG